jgi:hypothetical protein
MKRTIGFILYSSFASSQLVSKTRSNFSPARPPHSLNTGRIKKREILYTPQRPPIYNVPSEKEKAIKRKANDTTRRKGEKGKRNEIREIMQKRRKGNMPAPLRKLF